MRLQMNYLAIGSTPADEPCAQVGVTPDYPRFARAECQHYITALRKKYGEEPMGARLTLKANAHDAGTYYEVVCNFDPAKPAASKYAYAVEQGLSKWSEVNMRAPVTYKNGDFKLPHAERV